MAKFSKKVMGKEIGDATVYAPPHTMKGKTMDAKMTKEAVTKPGNGVDKVNMSVAGISKGNYPPENKYGKIQMRGTGAATKGKMSSGKMG
jgi:hypothetical protein